MKSLTRGHVTVAVTCHPVVARFSSLPSLTLRAVGPPREHHRNRNDPCSPTRLSDDLVEETQEGRAIGGSRRG